MSCSHSSPTAVVKLLVLFLAAFLLAPATRTQADPPAPRDVIAGVLRRIEGKIGGVGLQALEGKPSILKMRSSGLAIDGRALFSSSKNLIVRRVSVLKSRWKKGTTLKEFVEGGTHDFTAPAQIVNIFISTGWSPPRHNWRELPAVERGPENTHGAVVHTLKSRAPFKGNSLAPTTWKTINYKESTIGRAISMSGLAGRLYLTTQNGLRSVLVSWPIKQHEAVAVNGLIAAQGYLVVDEPGIRLGISVKATKVGKPWVPAISEVQFVNLLEIIAGAVRSEIGGGPPRPDPEPPEDSTPEPPTPNPEPPREEPTLQLNPISDVIAILVQAGEHEQELVRIRAKLRAGVVALKEERALLESVRESIAAAGRDSPYRAEREAWVKEIEATIAALTQEREALLEEAAKRWDVLRRNLDETIHGRNDAPAIQRDLQSFRHQLELRQQISDLELLFAAGKLKALRARLPAALDNPALAERASELRAGELLERGSMSLALYASRLGAKKYPDNPTFAAFVEDLESSYLKAISSRAVDDGARLRAAWDEYVEGAERGYGWQMFFGGLKRTYHRARGKTAKLEQLAKSGFDRAAVEHNGMELMLRLRKRGLSFDEIQDLDHEALRGWLIKIAPKRGPPKYKTVEDFSIALKSAFLNDDVIRLRYPGKAPMRLSKRSYYSAEEFTESWGEYALDAISAKNMLMIFGPAAKLGSVPGNLARLAARFGQGPRVAAAFGEKASALTIGEWVYSTRTAQGVASAVANTRAGGVLREAGHVLRELRYHDKTLVRLAAAGTGFATQVAGHWLMMEGAGALGERVGGESGRIAGELAAGLVGLPGVGSTARLEARMQRATAVMKQARAKAAVTQKILDRLSAPIHRATRSLARPGATLTVTQRTALQRAQRGAEAVASTARVTATQIGGSPLVNGVADEAEALAASARAALAGRSADALSAGQIARTLGAEVKQAARVLERSERQVGKAWVKARARGPTRTLKPTRPPPAPGSSPALIGDPVPPRKRIPKIGDLENYFLSTTPWPRRPPRTSVADLIGRAEKAMVADEFEEAAALLHTASRHRQLSAKLGPEVRLALAEARGAAKARRVFAARERLPRVARLAREADQATVAFDDTQRAFMGKLSRRQMSKFSEGAGGAYRIDGPDGVPLAVWKPGARGGESLTKDGQIAAELLMSRLGRTLGLKVPYAEPMMVDGLRGVVIRWIPKTHDLAKLSPGARAALKQQLARFRPLHVLMGNYDVHMGNFKLDRAGRVWAIDAGQSIMTTPAYSAPTVIEKLEGVSNGINWTRWLRDWYARAGVKEALYRPALRMQQLVTGRDMRRTATGLRNLSRDEIKAAIDEAVRTAPVSAKQAEKILSTLLERQGKLPLLLNERWSGALP